MTSLDFSAPLPLVQGFYRLQENRQFDESYDLLTSGESGLQSRKYKNDRAWFVKGYAYNVAIKNLKFDMLKEESDTAECKVTYADSIKEMHHWTIDQLQNIQNPKSAAASAFIASFQETLLEKGVTTKEKMAEISTNHLFEYNGIETYLWLMNADYRYNNILFTFKEATQEAAKIVTCIKTENGIWKIDNFRKYKATA